MSTPYVGEIRIFAGNFAILGWAFCDGSLVPISEYETLFNLIGTTYGGDGQQTFALPDLRGRTPVHQGTGPGLSTYIIGQSGGVERVTLTQNQLPAHTHGVTCTFNNANFKSPTGNIWAYDGSGITAGFAAPNQAPSVVSMSPTAITPTGGSQPHNNMQPYQTLNYIISFFGIFPSPS